MLQCVENYARTPARAWTHRPTITIARDLFRDTSVCGILWDQGIEEYEALLELQIFLKFEALNNHVLSQTCSNHLRILSIAQHYAF